MKTTSFVNKSTNSSEKTKNEQSFEAAVSRHPAQNSICASLVGDPFGLPRHLKLKHTGKCEKMIFPERNIETYYALRDKVQKLNDDNIKIFYGNFEFSPTYDYLDYDTNDPVNEKLFEYFDKSITILKNPSSKTQVIAITACCRISGKNKKFLEDKVKQLNMPLVIERISVRVSQRTTAQKMKDLTNPNPNAKYHHRKKGLRIPKIGPIVLEYFTQQHKIIPQICRCYNGRGRTPMIFILLEKELTTIIEK